MIRYDCKSLWHTVRISAIVFLWKYGYNTTFHKEPSPPCLWELRLFNQELAFLVKVKFGSFSKDDETLHIGAQDDTLAYMAFLEWEFPCNCIVRLL
jgi:hypothetical protein